MRDWVATLAPTLATLATGSAMSVLPRFMRTTFAADTQQLTLSNDGVRIWIYPPRFKYQLGIDLPSQR